jgi:hypothetical protein
MDLKAKIGTLVAGSFIAVAGLQAAGTAAFADTNVTTSSSCEDCESESGDAAAQNNSATFVGQNNGGGVNAQEGDNDADVDQDAQAESGDAASGQVVGVVSSGDGDTNVNASSTCEDCKSTSGNAFAQNNAIAFVGQNNGGGINVQDGDNDADVDQTSHAQTGDGVSGQIVGLVTI